MRPLLSAFLLLLPFAVTALDIDAQWNKLDKLYLHLHSNPELSNQEKKTAALMAQHFRDLGFEVTENVGGTGVVAVLRNGEGPTVLLRADMDGLPVLEKTGKPYASKVQMPNSQGVVQPAMHACGHDIHMTSLIGTLTELVNAKDSWSGTVVAIAQAAEEVGEGAAQLLQAGLFKKFPLPDFALALHANASSPVGTVAYSSGYSTANVDAVDILVHGQGGHGAYPQLTKDPIVLASQIVLALQTIASREIAAQDPVVVTVGAFHAGHKRNIISDSAKLELTVRTYSDATREHVLASIKRIAIGQAQAAGLPEDKWPEISMRDLYTPSAYNDPALVQRVVKVFRKALGDENVIESPPVMGGEDFGRYGKAGVPAMLFWLGTINPRVYDRAQRTDTNLPGLHSALYAPDYEPSIRAGVTLMTEAALDLLQRK